MNLIIDNKNPNIMTIHHIVTIKIGENPNTDKLLNILDNLVNNPTKCDEIIKKLDDLKKDIESTVE